jgi:O-antigen/teichoic acid export membrane protein
MKSNAKFLIKGSTFGIAEFFISAIITLAMTPFIIKSLGDNSYGLWIFVGSFLGYYGLMDFGLNSAVQRFLSRAIGKSDHAEANKVINTALGVFLIIGLLIFLLSGCLAFFMPLFVKNITDLEVFRKVTIILGINFALGFPLRIFPGILTANVRYDLNTFVEIAKTFIRALLIYFFLSRGHGIIALALITLTVDMVSYFVRYFIAKRLFAYIKLSFNLFDRSKFKEFLGYSVYTFISRIADQLRFNIDNLVITLFIGLGSVTLYSIAFRLVKYFMDFISSATGLFTPIFSQYESRGDYESIREKFIFTTKITGPLSIMIGGLIIVLGKAFIERWMGPSYLSAYKLLVILTVPLTIALMQGPSVQLLYGISKHRFFAISNTIEGIVNLILSVILVKKYGLVGVALGTAIPMMIIKLFVQPIFTCRAIKLSIRVYYFKILLPILFKGIICFLPILAFSRFIMPNYLNLLILSSLILLGLGCVYFIFGFNRFEKIYFKSAIGQIS